MNHLHDGLANQLKALQDAEDVCQGLLLSIRRAKEGIVALMKAGDDASSTAAEAVRNTIVKEMPSSAERKAVAQTLRDTAVPRLGSTQSTSVLSHSKRAKPRAMSHISPSKFETSAIGLAMSNWSTVRSPKREQPPVAKEGFVKDTVRTMEPRGADRTIASPRAGDHLSMTMLSYQPQREKFEAMAADFGDSPEDATPRYGSDSFVKRTREAMRPTLQDPSPEAYSEGPVSPLLQHSAANVANATEHLARLDASVRRALETTNMMGRRSPKAVKAVTQRVSDSADSHAIPASSLDYQERQYAIDTALERLRKLAHGEFSDDQEEDALPSAHTSDDVLSRLSMNMSSIQNETANEADAAIAHLMKALSKL